MPSDAVGSSDILISPLTFLQLYQSTGELMSAMQEQDVTFQHWFGRSGLWRRLARVTVVPAYYHWITSGYAASIGQDLAGWLFVRGRSQILYIETIATRPNWRRRGVGHALLRFAESLGRELDRAWTGMTVSQGNIPALRLYEEEDYRKSHWRVARIKGGFRRSPVTPRQVQLRPVSGMAAARAYRHFVEIDISAGETWAADAMLRLLNDDPHRRPGREWMIVAGGKPAGFLNKHGAENDAHIYMACAKEAWGQREVIEAALSVAGPLVPSSALTLRLSSSGHHDAALPILGEYGFSEEPAATMRMFKLLDHRHFLSDEPSGG